MINWRAFSFFALFLFVSPRVCFSAVTGIGIDGPLTRQLVVTSDGSGSGTDVVGFAYYRCLDAGGRVTNCDGIMAGTSTVCTIDGQVPPVVYGGWSFDLNWGSSGVAVFDDPSGTPYHQSSAVGLDVIVTAGAGSLFVGPEQMRLLCNYDFSSTGVEVDQVGAYPEGGRGVFSGLINVVNLYGFALTQPSHAHGVLGETIRMPFYLDLLDYFTTNSFTMSWVVTEPCASWAPSLLLESAPGTSLSPNGSDSVALQKENNLTAVFTPTEAGEFSCLGTLSVSVD